VKASPVARRIAQERGVDLHSVAGSGPGGRIVKADVEAAGAGIRDRDTGVERAPRPDFPPSVRPIPTPETAKGKTTTIELTKTQQVIARRMAESKATIPEFTLTTEVDMEDAVRGRDGLKRAAAEGTVPPTFNDMVIKACAIALREFPRVNGGYRDGQWELYERVNVGVAVAAEDALIVPTLFDADKRPLGEIAQETRRLSARVRDGSITPPELSGGTFTVSNLGMFGITEFTAIINPPQAALLSIGAIEQRPVVREGEIVPRHVMAMTIACDHRILYGADAAQFLARVRELLESPLSLAV
jgi:pyruvate dehydrogenase E2 component (dihydrolipoamide acetyltransferase)